MTFRRPMRSDLIAEGDKVATRVSGSATNWPPPAYSPDTGLFYVPENNNLSIRYLIDSDPSGSMGLGRVQGDHLDPSIALHAQLLRLLRDGEQRRPQAIAHEVPERSKHLRIYLLRARTRPRQQAS